MNDLKQEHAELALEYHINSEEGLINLRGDAQISIADIYSCGERLLSDAAFDANLPQLIDLRQARIETDCLQPGPSSIFVHRFNETVQANVAVVIEGGLTHLEIAELFRLTCMLEQAELFDNYDQALRWLIRTEFAARPPLGALRLSGKQPDPAREQTH